MKINATQQSSTTTATRTSKSQKRERWGWEPMRSRHGDIQCDPQKERDAMTDNEREMNEKKERVRSDGHLITDDTGVCITNRHNESHPPTFDSSPTRVVCVRRYCLRHRHHRLNPDVVVEVVAVAVLVVPVVVAASAAAAVATDQPAHYQHHSH